MRELTIAECEMASGGHGHTQECGWGSSCNNLDDVIVDGYQWEFWDWSCIGNGYGDNNGDGGGGGPQAPVAELTPCVETTFTSGADLAQVNNAALAAANAITALNDDSWEYSSIIWYLNGTYGFTTPYTDRDPGNVNLLGSGSGVPDGAVVVGIVHNHPDLAGIDDRIPSHHQNGDWDQYDRILALTNLARGITIDPNLLLYIHTNEDNKTRVYDKTDKTSQSPTCSLQ